LRSFWDPQGIEARSFEIIEELVGKTPGYRELAPEERAVVCRVVHTTGDLEMASSVRMGPGAVLTGIRALKKGTRIFADVKMVQVGINVSRLAKLGGEVYCLIDDPAVVREAERQGITRAAAAVQAACPEGQVVAIGNAPTALSALCDLVERGHIQPALVVGTPVGFVGAAEAKERLVNQDVPWITTCGTRGGSAVAAAVVNALILLALDAGSAYSR